MSRYTEARLRLFTGNRAWRLLLATLLLPLLIACGSSEEAPSTAAVQITLLPGQSANELQVGRLECLRHRAPGCRNRSDQRY